MNFIQVLTIIILLKIKWSFADFSGHDPGKHAEFVDFTDMGSYKLNVQRNDLNVRARSKSLSSLGGGAADPSVSQGALEVRDSFVTALLDTTQVEEQSCDTCQVYLRRFVSSLLRQLQVNRHFFGPGETLTIDLRGEISYSDLQVLKKFSSPPKNEESDPILNQTHLKKIDDILDGLFTVVELPPTPNFFWNALHSLKDLGLGFSDLIMSFKFWIFILVVLIFTFLFFAIFLKMRSTDSPLIMIFYGFLLIFILSTVWMYKGLYEEARSENYARIVQNSERPKDCEYYEMGWWETIWYYIRTELGAKEDRCVQYYKEMQVDPLWRISPVDAITATSARLVFGPLDYVGKKLGSFFYNIVELFWWPLRPILVIFLFILTFMGVFGFRVSSPFFSLEPARFHHHHHQNHGNALPPNQNPAQIHAPEPPGQPHLGAPNPSNLVRIQGQIVRLRRIDKSCQVDTEDLKDFVRRSRFGGYLENTYTRTARASRRSGGSYTYLEDLWSFMMFLASQWLIVLDILFRRIPNWVEPPRPQQDDDNQELD